MKTWQVDREKGITLPSVMVALGMAGILMLVVTQLTVSATTSQRYVMQRQESYARYMSLLGALSVRSVCDRNLQNKPIDGSTNIPSFVREASGPAILEVNQEYGDGLVTLTKVTLDNFQPYVAGGSDGTADLILEFTGKGQGIAARTVGQNVLLAVTLNGGGNIQTCVAVGNDIDDIWQYNPAGNAVVYQGTFVGIGTDLPADMLHVHGGNIQASAFLHDSDIRLKTDIKELHVGDDINQLRGVEFRWKDTGVKSIGVIAQDVEKVYPELVSTDKRTGMKRVSYDLLVVPLLQHQKEMQQQLMEIQTAQQALDRKIESLREQIKN